MSERVLILWADDSSANLGVRVLAQGTAAIAIKAAGSLDVAFHYSDDSTDAPMGLGRKNVARALLDRKHPLARWMSGFGLVIDTGSGDSFTDIYGMPRLWSIAAARLLAVRYARRVVLGPQTIGPFESTAGRRLARASMFGVDEVFARDPVSKQFALQTLRVDAPLTTDVVFALPRDSVGKPRDVVFNVSGLLWEPNPHVDYARYREAAISAVSRLVQAGREVSLLVHVLKNDTDDADHAAARALASSLPGHADLEIIVPSDLADVRATVGAAEVVIGSRMHACLNALSMGTPSIPWAYSRKFDPLLSNIGWTETLYIGDPEIVNRTVDALSRINRAGVADTRRVAELQLDVVIERLRGNSKSHGGRPNE